ncbi:hypothetical protein [Nocardioides sp. CER19]|uniref:hypothetical protein n=1 Tax=Nocardioides sp. CER19 TaxID=3038538 RepID=UPI00244AA0EB|nr:hypothetical protein [Nocardioides sp. CER19]MDH2412569.1 hypothetical protein [Nocardioides sp. CER19]
MRYPPAQVPTVIQLGRAPAMLQRGAVLLGEAVVIPGVLLYAFAAAGHAMAGLLVVLGWRSACILGRIAGHRRVPTTCWFAFALFLARACGGLAAGSVSLYLLIPVVLCALQGLFFVGSALAERPVMMRLAADYTADLPDSPTLRRLFAQLSGTWGVVHLVCAALGAWAITLPTPSDVAVTSALAIGCTVASVGGCIAWGLWRMARIPGVRLVFADRPAPREVVAPERVPAAA